MSQQSESKRSLTGKVVSDKADKTIKVYIEYQVKHPKYGKYINKHTKLLVHDPDNSARIGDIVSIRESRPFSKRKAWMLVHIVKKAEQKLSSVQKARSSS